MNEKQALNVVIGASGGAGSAVTRELARRGKRVRAVNRSQTAVFPNGVEVFPADVQDAMAVREACRGASVVYNCIGAPYHRWPELLPLFTDNIIEAAAAAGARLIVTDNLYMYGPVAGPMTEQTPYGATSRKGQVRVAMARTLMEAHRSGKVRVAIGRASDFYGPAVIGPAAGGDSFKAALAGKRASWLGSLDVPHTLSYTGDFARGLIRLGERDEALGEIWHVPAAEPLTGRQFLKMVFEEAGRPPRIGVYKRPLLRIVGLFSPVVRELVEMLYQFEAPFVMDGRKFDKAFGPFVPSPHREAIRQTLAWHETQE